MKILLIGIESLLLLPLHTFAAPDGGGPDGHQDATMMLRKVKQQQQHRRLPHFTSWDGTRHFFSSPLCGPGTLNMVSGASAAANGDEKQRPGGLFQVHAEYHGGDIFGAAQLVEFLDVEEQPNEETNCLGTGRITWDSTTTTDTNNDIPFDSFFDIEYRIDCSGDASLLTGKLVEATANNDNAATETIEIELVALHLSGIHNSHGHNMGLQHDSDPPPPEPTPRSSHREAPMDLHVWLNARLEYDEVNNRLTIVDPVDGSPITRAPDSSYTRTTVAATINGESCSRQP